MAKPQRKKEYETASGWIVTRITCPNCGTVFDVEGDAEGDIVKCDDCQSEARCRRT